MCRFSISQGTGNGYFIVTVTGGSVSPTGKIHDIGSSDGSNTGTYSAQAYGSGDSCSGTVTYTFTWYSPNPRMPVPTNAILKETSGAGWTESPGSCADGLGDPEIDNNPPNGGGSSGTHYAIEPVSGGTFSIPITATANANQTSTVTETVVGTPVLMSVSGTTVYGSQLCGLIGYHETAVIEAQGYVLNQWRYTVSGPEVYKSATGPTADNHSWNFLEAGDLVQPNVTYAFGTGGQGGVSGSGHVFVNGVDLGQVKASANVYDSMPWSYLEAPYLGDAGYYTPDTEGDHTPSPNGENPTGISSSPKSGDSDYTQGDLTVGIDFWGYVCEATWQQAAFGSAWYATSQTVNRLAMYLDLSQQTVSLDEKGNDTHYPYPFGNYQGYWLPVPSQDSDPAKSLDLTYDTPGYFRFYMGYPGYVTSYESFEHFLVFNAGASGNDDVPVRGLNWSWDINQSWVSKDGNSNQFWNVPVPSALSGSADGEPFLNFLWNVNVT